VWECGNYLTVIRVVSHLSGRNYEYIYEYIYLRAREGVDTQATYLACTDLLTLEGRGFYRRLGARINPLAR
jgi:hypothetical protein